MIGCRDNRGVQYETPKLDFKTAFNNDFVLPQDWDITLWAESPDL